MSCLFNSLSYFIQEPSNNIRQKICDYIEQNKSLIDMQISISLYGEIVKNLKLKVGM